MRFSKSPSILLEKADIGNEQGARRARKTGLRSRRKICNAVRDRESRSASARESERRSSVRLVSGWKKEYAWKRIGARRHMKEENLMRRSERKTPREVDRSKTLDWAVPNRPAEGMGEGRERGISSV